MSSHPEDRLLTGLVVVLIALLLAIPVAMIIIMALGGFGTYGFEMMQDMGTSWWTVAIPAVGLLVIAILLVIILGSPRRGPLPPVPYPPYFPVQEEPLAILDRRLASGEISLDEYLRLREHLTRR